MSQSDDDKDKEVPSRCRMCSHWMGRYSGDDNDQRCNRNWGHEAAHGDFYGPDQASKAFGQPAEVEYDCKVPRFGPPLPPVDHNGDTIGPRPEPDMVDAFVRARPERVAVTDGGETRHLNAQELRTYINTRSMSSDNPFAELDKSRKATAQKNQQLHDDRMNTSGELGSAADLPPWMRGEERVPTGFPQLDWALGGGFCPGIKFKHWGSYQTWKTTLSMAMMGAHQRYRDQKIEENFGRIADYHGFEASDDALEATLQSQKVLGLVGEDFDPSWAARQGVDIDRMDIYDMKYMEEALQYLVENLKEDLDRIESNFNAELASYIRAINYFHILVDSLDSFKLWADEHGSKDSKNVLHDDARMASRASLLSKFYRVFSDAPQVPVTFSAMAQQRINMGAGMAYASGKKGNAEAHNTRVSMRHKTDKPKRGEQTITLEFYQTQHPGVNIGQRETIELIGVLGQGMRPEANVVKTAVETGVVNKSSWLTYEPDDSEKISQQGTDYLPYAETLKKEGVYQEVYDKALDALYEERGEL